MADQVPSFNIYEIERRRTRIVNRMQDSIGQVVDADALTRLLRTVLPGEATVDAVFESIRYLAGRTLSDDEAIRLAWRLAGNIPRLKAGLPVPPWTVQQEDEWVPLQVLRMIKMRNSKDKLGYDATLRVLAGTPAPMKINTFWSSGALKLIASDVGFSKPWDAYPFKGASAMVGLRFIGRIEAERSRGRPSFFEVRCPQSMIKWNRDNVLKLRLRVGMSCPMNYRHECWHCAIGYDQCAAGTHFRTYELGPCNGCNQQEAAFDPEDPSLQCVNCTAVIRQRRNQQ